MNNLNFIDPVSPKQQEAFSRLKKVAIIASIALVATMLTITLYKGVLFLYHRSRYHTAHRELQQKDAMLQQAHTLQRTQETLHKQYETLVHMNGSKTVRLIQEIARALPARVALTTLKKTKKQIQLTGKAQDIQEITNFTNALRSSGLFEQVQLQAVNQAPPNQQKLTDEWRFTIQGNLIKSTKQDAQKSVEVSQPKRIP